MPIGLGRFVSTCSTKKLVIFRDYVTFGGLLNLGVPWNHPFEKDIAKPSILGYIGGDFTRSWLSLPLSHSTKVKGGEKKTFWGIPHLWKPPFIFIYHSGNTDFARLELKWPSWYTTTGCGSWATSFNGIAMEIFSGLVFSGRIYRKTPDFLEEHPWFFRLGLFFKPMKISMEYSWNIGIWVEYIYIYN